MDLTCEKHRETMAREGAHCLHPQEYCKFRTACLIHFIGKEAQAAGPTASPRSGEVGEHG